MEPNDLKKRFVGIYGGDESDLRVFSAAGRVNLIGEHIDYCGGKVFPAALNLRTTVVARKNGENVIRLAATTIDDRVTLDIGNLNAYRDLKWGDYQAGVAYVMRKPATKSSAATFFTIPPCRSDPDSVRPRPSKSLPV